MADSESGGLDIDSMLEMVEQLGMSYDEMVSHKESLSHNKSLLVYIKQHFYDIQKSLQEKFDELENKRRAFEEKKAEHRALVEKQEAAVAAKEQVLWDHLQELKDAAVSAITEARKEIKVACPVLDNKVHASANEFSNATFPAQEEYSPVNNVSKSADALTGKVEPRPRLKQLCEQMDAKGLLKLILENRKNFAAISDELPLALRSAPKPADLVLETIEGFYPQNLSNTNLNAKDSNNLLILRRSCLLLMESAAPLLGMSEPGGQPGGDHLLSSENKQRAKVTADEWNLKLAEVDLDASNGYSLEAQAFLQLLATFSISSEFNKDELCKLVVAVSRRRRQAPEFCRALDLTHKAQDVIAAVIAKGRLIDAVHLSHSFLLTEVFPLVPLLKQYFDDAMENWGRTIAAGAEKEALNQELGALKAVVKCVEEYKLQEEYPLDGLKNRIEEIEKAKTDKKRAAESTTFPRKNPRANGGYGFRRAPIAVDNRLKAPYDGRALYYGGGDRYPGRYQQGAPPAYEVAGHVPYGHQANAPRPYHYPDERAPPYNPSSNYGNYMSPAMQSAQSNYGNYMSSGMQSASSNYGNYMGSSVPSSHQPYM